MIFDYGVNWRAWALPLSFYWDRWHDGNQYWWDVIFKFGPVWLQIGKDEI
jgi:hypothetical protein